ncbi:MAG: DUF2974 domain-containing protein [Treponema sp.]|jgi:hypothetical protein|nr:DUF2974 domain-containing protein [Treponema sp.]
MANLFDYITWRGDLDCKKSPLNPVDFLIFSQLSYLPFDGIVPSPEEKEEISLQSALEIILEKLHTTEAGFGPVLGFKEDPDFINALINSNRFGNCRLLGYVNHIDTEREIQFSALCIYTGHGDCIISFRGTDSSFVGWKENFNMAFKEVVPSQQEAVKYLVKMFPPLKRSLHICGHSKGGNLAVYAASFCGKKMQRRITGVHSYDAPGFHESVIKSDSYTKIKDKIYCYIPQASIIGMMLEQGCRFNVVKSSQTGLMQHFLFSWEVTHNDIVRAEKVNLKSRYVDKTIREWVGKLDNEKREQFIEGVYRILRSSEVKSVHEMESSWPLSLGRILKSLGNIDESTRVLTLKTIAGLFRSARNNINTLLHKEPN